MVYASISRSPPFGVPSQRVELLTPCEGGGHEISLGQRRRPPCPLLPACARSRSDRSGRAAARQDERWRNSRRRAAPSGRSASRKGHGCLPETCCRAACLPLRPSIIQWVTGQSPCRSVCHAHPLGSPVRLTNLWSPQAICRSAVWRQGERPGAQGCRSRRSIPSGTCREASPGPPASAWRHAGAVPARQPTRCRSPLCDASLPPSRRRSRGWARRLPSDS